MTTPTPLISLTLDLHNAGSSEIKSSVPFLDHMLEAFSKHGYFDLKVQAPEGIPSGGVIRLNALGTALGCGIADGIPDRKGLVARGFFLLPMDETLSIVSVDLLKKPLLIYNVQWAAHAGLGELDGKLLKGFFESVALAGQFELSIELRYGKQPHHIAESIFKGFAKALSQAVQSRQEI